MLMTEPGSAVKVYPYACCATRGGGFDFSIVILQLFHMWCSAHEVSNVAEQLRWRKRVALNPP